MFGLFGKKKKKKPVREDPATKKAKAMEVLNKLKMKYQTDEARLDHLEGEIKRVKKLLVTEKKKKKPDMRVIKRHFASWKMKEKQYDTYNNYLISTQKQIDSIETQMGAADTVALMKSSAAYIKANQPNVEEVEDVTSDLAEGVEDLDEVNNLIGEHANLGMDEDDMMGELEDMLDAESEEDEIDVELPTPSAAVSTATELPDAPTADLPAVAEPTAAKTAAAPKRVPIAVGASSTTNDDEAELEAWFGS